MDGTTKYMDGTIKYMDGALFRFKIREFSDETEKTIMKELINICICQWICSIKYVIE